MPANVPLGPRKALKERKMKKFFWHLLSSAEGTTAIEYALIAFFVTTAIFLLLATMSGSVQSLFSTVASSFP